MTEVDADLTASREAHREKATDVDVFGRAPKDRPDWSHRRGEPRGLFLGWLVYMLIASGAAFSSAGIGGSISVESYRASASRFALALMVGLFVLWPMLRLSQAAPRRPLRSIAVDLAVLLVPLQVVIWPHVFLAAWPPLVCAGLSAATGGWALVAASLLGVCISAGGVAWRVSGVIAVLTIGLGVPTALAVGGAGLDVPWVSPLTAAAALTRDQTWSGGTVGPGGEAAWRIGWITLACGVSLLLAAGGAMVAVRRGRA